MLDQLDSVGKGINIAVEVSSVLDYENISTPDDPKITK